MSKSRFNDLMEILVSNNPSKTKLKKLGITQADIDNYNENLSDDFGPVVYNRILAEDEKRAIAPAAFGYLLDLIRIRSIDKQTAEQMIIFATQLSSVISQRIDKSMIDEMINFMKFSGLENVTANDIIELFLINKNFIHFKGIIN